MMSKHAETPYRAEAACSYPTRTLLLSHDNNPVIGLHRKFRIGYPIEHREFGYSTSNRPRPSLGPQRKRKVRATQRKDTRRLAGTYPKHTVSYLALSHLPNSVLFIPRGTAPTAPTAPAAACVYAVCVIVIVPSNWSEMTDLAAQAVDDLARGRGRARTVPRRLQ
jgi:hypothetical protein